MLPSFHKLIGVAIIIGLLTPIMASPLSATPVAEFYKGNTIILHMGFPGGGFFIPALSTHDILV